MPESYPEASTRRNQVENRLSANSADQNDSNVLNEIDVSNDEAVKNFIFLLGILKK